MMAKKNSRPMPCLTPRQVDVLTVIRDFRRTVGCAPSLQQIADKLSIGKITVFEHVGNLVAKGLLRHQANKPRSLELTEWVRLPDDRPTIVDLVEELVGPLSQKQVAKLIGSTTSFDVKDEKSDA